MSRKSSYDPDAAQKIIESYERAKQRDPNISGPDFMWQVPAMRERFKNKETAGAYLRVLRQGRRTGGQIYEEAQSNKEKGLYQVTFKVQGEDRYVSRNLSVANADSEFDIPAIAAKLREPERADKMRDRVEAFARKHSDDNIRLSKQFSIRQVAQQRRPALRMSI